MYLVIEIQKSEDGKIAYLVTTHGTRPEADSKYHLILSSAAVSGLPCHSAIILREDATPCDWKSYSKQTAPEPNEE